MSFDHANLSSLGFSGQQAADGIPTAIPVRVNVTAGTPSLRSLGDFEGSVHWSIDDTLQTWENVEGDCSPYLTVPLRASLRSTSADIEWTGYVWYSTTEIGQWPGGFVSTTRGDPMNAGDWYTGEGEPYLVISEEWASLGHGDFVFAVQPSADTDPVLLAAGTMTTIDRM